MRGNYSDEFRILRAIETGKDNILFLCKTHERALKLYALFIEILGKKNLPGCRTVKKEMKIFIGEREFTFRGGDDELAGLTANLELVQ